MLICVGLQELAGIAGSVTLAAIARILGVTVALGYLLGSPYYCHKAAVRRALDGEGFIEAMRGAWWDVRLELSMVPIIGGLFAPRSGDEDEWPGKR
jgi:hypothetical protein